MWLNVWLSCVIKSWLSCVINLNVKQIWISFVIVQIVVSLGERSVSSDGPVGWEGDGWETAILPDEGAALEIWSLESLSDDSAANFLIWSDDDVLEARFAKDELLATTSGAGGASWHKIKINLKTT